MPCGHSPGGPRFKAPFDPSASGSNSLDHLAMAASGLLPTAVDKAELHEVVEQALATLNPKQRMAVLLSKFEGDELQRHCRDDANEPSGDQVAVGSARDNLREALEPYLKNS